MIQETLCRQYIELRIAALQYNNVRYALTFEDSGALKSWKLDALKVDVMSSRFQSSLFLSNGLPPTEKVKLERMKRVLAVMAKYMGAPKLVLGGGAPNTIDHDRTYLKFEWEESFESLSEALPSSGTILKESDKVEFKLYKALKAMPDAPKGWSAESMQLALKQFMDTMHRSCVVCIQRELNSIWFGAAEMSSRIMPKRVWKPMGLNKRYEVVLDAGIGESLFIELPSLTDQDLVYLSRGKRELLMLNSRVEDFESGSVDVIHHGWHLFPTRPSEARQYALSLRERAVNSLTVATEAL